MAAPLLCGLRQSAKLQGKPFGGPEDPVALCDEFLRLVHEYHAGQYREGRPFEEYETILQRQFRKPGPPPEACKNLPEEDWLDAQDHRFNFANYGTWVKIVDDAAASDGQAARMPGSHFEWATSYNITPDMQAGNPWHVYAAVRCDASTDEGTAMTLGIYDGQDKKGIMSKSLPVVDIKGPDYRIIDLGVYELKPTMYLWFAPPKRPGEVEAVYIDRVYFIRERAEKPTK